MKMTKSLILITFLGLILFGTVAAQKKDAASKTKFTSVYTDFEKDCTRDDGEENRSANCKGVGGYGLSIEDNDCCLDFSITLPEGTLEEDEYPPDWLQLDSQLPDFDKKLKGRKAEWRLADGKPFAVIIRFDRWGYDPDARVDKVTGEYLIVQGLKDFESIRFEIDTKKTPQADEKVRGLAEAAYLQQKSGGAASAIKTPELLAWALAKAFKNRSLADLDALLPAGEKVKIITEMSCGEEDFTKEEFKTLTAVDKRLTAGENEDYRVNRVAEAAQDCENGVCTYREAGLLHNMLVLTKFTYVEKDGRLYIKEIHLTDGC